MRPQLVNGTNAKVKNNRGTYQGAPRNEDKINPTVIIIDIATKIFLLLFQYFGGSRDIHKLLEELIVVIELIQ
jgi:hypothetical protein